MAVANGNGIHRGAGVVAPAPSHVTACANSRNPYGHNPNCPCAGPVEVPTVDVAKLRAWKRARASQTAPYQGDDV